MINFGDHGMRVAAAFGIARSPHWHKVAAEHLAQQPFCVCCKPGQHGHHIQQVHHIFPFHYCVALGRPDLELDQRNLITLCGPSKDDTGMNHHLWVGHLDNFQSSNLYVVRDAEKTFCGMTAGQIKNDARWMRHLRRRLKPLDEMTPIERTALLNLMNRRMPEKTIGGLNALFRDAALG
jgi:hypothetical protein